MTAPQQTQFKSTISAVAVVADTPAIDGSTPAPSSSTDQEANSINNDMDTQVSGETTVLLTLLNLDPQAGFKHLLLYS
jgi:hypothetical protein